MHPFAQNIRNPAASAPHPQQVPNNLIQFQPQMGFINPPMNSTNNSIPPAFMNMPPFNALQQNTHLGVNPLLGSLQQSNPQFCPPNFGHNMNLPGFSSNGQMNLGQNMNQGNPNLLYGQFGGWQNQVQGQNMNQLGNVVLNPAQIAALTQLMGCANQVGQGMFPQNAGFFGNSKTGLVQPSGGLQQGNFGQQLPVVSQQFPNVSAGPSFPAMPQQQHNHSMNLQMQGNPSKQYGMHMLNPRQQPNKSFVKNPKTNPRFQKSQGDQMHHRNKIHKVNKPNRKERVREARLDDTESNIGKQRPPLWMLYTKKEIQKWREERKKNYPSKANIEKKSHKQGDNSASEEHAKLRRQELKEVVAKQVELGLPVCELAPEYELDHVVQIGGRPKNKKFPRNCRSRNSLNKRETGHMYKRLKQKGDASPNTPVSVREPTLLQKLLGADIKRDKSRLLQALRFMVMNSFFKDCPEKPLSFPTVIVREPGDSNEESSSLMELTGRNEADDASDDNDCENIVCQEEGEITD